MPLLPVTMLLKIVLFNPMTLCFGRDAEVSTVLSRFDVIGCPGSRAMQYEKTDTVLLKELDFHWAFEFPRLRVPERSQRVIAAHTGCTILLNKRRFSPSQVIRCFYPQLVKDKLIVGRFGGIRVQSGLHDFLFVVMYFPLPSNPKFIAIVLKMIEWYSETLSAAGTRTTPYTLMDVNDGAGLQKLPDGSWVHGLTHLVGNYQRSREGFAMKNLREVLEPHSQALINTHFDAGSTYFHHDHSSTRPDYIAGPFSLVQNQHISLCAVSRVLARKLQHIKDYTKLRDHAPLVLIVCQGPAAAAAANAVFLPRWDWNRVMKAWQQPCDDRTHFIENVENDLAEKEQLLEEAKLTGTPDMHWNLLNETVVENFTAIFSADNDPLVKQRKARQKERVTAIKRRAELRASLIESVDLEEGVPLQEQPAEVRLQLQQVAQQLEDATAGYKKVRSQQAQQRQHQLCSDLEEAWYRRDFSECWKNARYLAKTSRGPKKRRYGLANVYRPSAAEYRSFFALPSSEGGMSAQPIIWQDEYKDIQDSMPVLPPPDLNHVVESFRDYAATSRALLRASHRRACPMGGAPSEAWCMLSFPNNVYERCGSVRKSGVGHKAPKLFNPRFRKFRRHLGIQIRRCEATPLQWHKSRCAGLDKHNRKIGPPSKRHIHILDHFGKSYHVGLMSKLTDKPRYTAMTHGCVRGRRRQGAIASKLILNHKLKKKGKSFVNIYHDAANAFASVRHPAFDSVLPEVVLEKDVNIAKQCYSQACISIETFDEGVIELLPTEGGMQGSALVVELFNRAYAPAICDWQLDLAVASDEYRDFAVSHAPDGSPVDLSLGLYVDDVGKTLPVEPTADSVADTVQLECDLLDTALQEKVGTTQNREKLVVTPCLTGKGTNDQLRLLYAGETQCPGKVTRSARYLGPMIQPYGHNGVERQKRIQETKIAYHRMGAYWRSRSPFRMKRIIFQAIVGSTSLSGLDAFAWPEADSIAIDKVVLALARRASGKFAFEYAPLTIGQFRSKSNLQIRRDWKLIPHAVELRIRRLQWYQQMALAPSNHTQVLASLFGVIPGEQKAVTEEGRIIKRLAHPWLKQLDSDLQELAQTETASSFFQEVDGRFLLLFDGAEENREWIEYFAYIDLSILRASSLIDASQPLDAQTPADMENLPFLCNIDNCTASFCDNRALQAHVRKKHKLRYVLDTLVACNECMFCYSTFADIPKTQRHVNTACRTGQCYKDRSPLVHSVNHIENFQCPACHFNGASHNQMQRHFRCHVHPELRPKAIILRLKRSKPTAENLGTRSRVRSKFRHAGLGSSVGSQRGQAAEDRPHLEEGSGWRKRRHRQHGTHFRAVRGGHRHTGAFSSVRLSEVQPRKSGRFFRFLSAGQRGADSSGAAREEQSLRQGDQNLQGWRAGEVAEGSQIRHAEARIWFPIPAHLPGDAEDRRGVFRLGAGQDDAGSEPQGKGPGKGTGPRRPAFDSQGGGGHPHVQHPGMSPREPAGEVPFEGGPVHVDRRIHFLYAGHLHGDSSGSGRGGVTHHPSTAIGQREAPAEDSLRPSRGSSSSASMRRPPQNREPVCVAPAAVRAAPFFARSRSAGESRTGSVDVQLPTHLSNSERRRPVSAETFGVEGSFDDRSGAALHGNTVSLRPHRLLQSPTNFLDDFALDARRCRLRGHHSTMDDLQADRVRLMKRS